MKTPKPATTSHPHIRLELRFTGSPDEKPTTMEDVLSTHGLGVEFDVPRLAAFGSHPAD